MDIGWAVSVLNNGGKVARRGWDDQSMYLELHPGIADAEDGVGTVAPFIAIRTPEWDYRPWGVTQTDVLADDWVQV